jgi:hypothetical protein
VLLLLLLGRGVEAARGRVLVAQVAHDGVALPNGGAVALADRRDGVLEERNNTEQHGTTRNNTEHGAKQECG